ncbi:mitogen-activated protein kinase-binding protein 1-like isoform X2 [Biomphalaria glabrata]|uniref:Mitogen-activated protein kinase-binding protein 1-like isoform X2 n=1 Tax=Biomphalaria glabrata TaxID=6526 RepID=A0A9W2ZU76_BIOGL|nr:mitogen-activated protein kinase-binding protein 1-like isoform X2 [Biomphalaria glabrata]
MDNARPQRKILRSPSVKRKSKVLPINQRVQLQRVLGVTVSSNAGLSCDSNNGTIAYPAGCVVVLFNPRRNKQSHIFNTTKKTITALAFSRDGKHLITGETGHQPAVRVWDVAEKTQVAEFRGHKFGINCVAFSPNMKEIVSVGTQHDMMINVWNWKTGNKVASNKVSSKVSALAFSEDGKCFVTVGNRHVRFWYLEEKRSKINQTVPLMGRSGILGDQKDNFFCDVVAGQGPMCGRFFVITQSGLLCEFNEKRQLDKWVELRTKSATCITTGADHIFVGCAEGVVRVFKSTTLLYVCSLPKPHHLGVEVTTATNPSHMVSNREDAKYPDTKAIAIDDDHKKVTCVYNDRSIYIWDVHDIKRVGKAWSFLYHSGCIWSLEVYPQLDEGVKSTLPPGSFLTASGDDTIRVWNLNTHMPENTAYKRNIYSNELLKIVYVDPTLASLCNVDYNPAGAADKTDTTYDGKNGVRSIRVSPDGGELASGDRQGNIRIYDMNYLNEKRCVEAHDSDVMCLEYSYTEHGKFLATSSRDRLIHVFDVDQNYGLVQTLGDHSSSITAVRFTDTDDKLRMISCGADKSILVRTATTVPEFQFQLEHHLATKITLYDMVIDPTQKCLATACQDRNVRLYNIQTTKEKKCYKGSSSDEGILLRIHLDPSGTYAATTCTDKNVCILDFNTGELMATMYGHSEVITGVKFANDLKHVITVSADGCIFVWRLPSDMTNHIKGRLHELGKQMKDTDYFRSDQPLMPNPILMETTANDGNFPILKSASVGNIHRFYHDDTVDGKLPGDDEEKDDANFDDVASTASLDYRFSIGQLPNWAKAKFGDTHSDGSESSQEQLQPKGRWAQRADHNIEFKSQLDVTTEEDGLNSQNDQRKTDFGSTLFSNIRRETVVLGGQPRNKGTPVIDEDITAPFGDLKSLPASARELREMEAMHRNKLNHYKSDTALNLFGSGLRRSLDHFDYPRKDSLDLDDTDELDTGSDTTEVIYPPTETDSDIFESTYQVYAAEEKNVAKSSLGNVSNQDDTSESTDPISLEEDEDHNDETLAVSTPPTTPSDPDKEFLSTTPDKEDFVRDNFEEDAFTPVPLEKFMKSVDKLERQVADGTLAPSFESTPFSPRLSLSARFMSRALPLHKSTVSGQLPYKPDNWFNRNKMEMSRAMDETRKSLLAAKETIAYVHMNLRSNICESPEKEDPPSPPTKLEEKENKLPAVETETVSYSSSPTSVFVSPPWGYCSKNLRRVWANFSLTQDSIVEETLTVHSPRCCSHRVRSSSSESNVTTKTFLKPCPPHLVFQSRIPTPRSSPRPCRRASQTQTATPPNLVAVQVGRMPEVPSPCRSRRNICKVELERKPEPPSPQRQVSREKQTTLVSRERLQRSLSSPRERQYGSDLDSRMKNNFRDQFTKPKSPHLISTSSLKTTVSTSPTSTNQGLSTVAQVLASSVQGPAARRISQEKEKRRSRLSLEQSTAADTTDISLKSSVRPRPTYFRPTQSSKNKTNKPGESDIAPLVSRPLDLGNRKPRQKSSLANSKLAMYASTPNLIQGAEDQEPAQKPRGSEHKFSSTSNLLMFSDLSRSVPDINDADSSTDSSSSGSVRDRLARRSCPMQVKLISKYSVTKDQQLMPPPSSIPNTSSSKITNSTLQQIKKYDIDVQPRRKISASEMTLDQAKSILSGKSGILTKTPNVLNTTVSSRAMQFGRDARSSNLSTVASDTPTFDTELAHADPTQLAVAEEIEYTANMLRHQKQANISGHFSPERINSNPPSNLEASPLDLPERDQPSPSQRRISPKPSQSSQTFHTSRQNIFVTKSESSSKELGKVVDNLAEEDGSAGSIKDRIAKFQSTSSSTTKARRALPLSPSTSFSDHREHSDIGPGSESSDPEITYSVDTATYSLGQKALPGSTDNLETKSGKRLTLSLPPSSSQPAVTLTQCQSVLNDFRDQVNKIKDIFLRVEERTDEDANQMLVLLGELFQETLQVFTELASKAASSNPPQPTQHPTFHVGASAKTSGAGTDQLASSSVAGSSSQDEPSGQDNQMTLLTATKDMLQPLMSQLSQELSLSILKMIKAKVDES